MGGMATYMVTSQTDRRGGFDIAIVGHDGVRQTILGFRAPAGLLRLVRPLAQRSARARAVTMMGGVVGMVPVWA
jgi:hypothetical protein